MVLASKTRLIELILIFDTELQVIVEENLILTRDIEGKMNQTDLEMLVAKIPSLDLEELRSLEMVVKVAIQIRSQGNLSIDAPEHSCSDEEGPGLHDQARMILGGLDLYELTLADQAILASLILSDAYHQDTFSSRDINDIIVECGRPRVAHITSAVTGLTSRSYLHADEKSLSLSPEGRSKARGLIGMIKRKTAA